MSLSLTDCFRPHPTGVLLLVRVQPRACRSEIVGEQAGRLRVRVTSPPVDGRANRDLCRLLAKSLRVTPSSVSVRTGEKSRQKTLHIAGIDVKTAVAALTGT